MQQSAHRIGGSAEDLGRQVAGLRGQDLEEEVGGVRVQQLGEVAQRAESHERVGVILRQPADSTPRAVGHEGLKIVPG